MISPNQTKKLKENWGDKASALSCKCEVCFVSKDFSWKCYIYAMDPQDENRILCVVKISRNRPASLESWTMQEIMGLFDHNGEGVEIDKEFRPIMADVLLKNLNRNHIYDR